MIDLARVYEISVEKCDWLGVVHYWKCGRWVGNMVGN